MDADDETQVRRRALRRLLRLPVRTGIKTREEEVDEYVYGRV